MPKPKPSSDMPIHMPAAKGMLNVSTPNTNAFDKFFFKFSKSISKPARNMI